MHGGVVVVEMGECYIWGNQINKYIKDSEASYCQEKGFTNREKEKTGMNPVVLNGIGGLV